MAARKTKGLKKFLIYEEGEAMYYLFDMKPKVEKDEDSPECGYCGQEMKHRTFNWFSGGDEYEICESEGDLLFGKEIEDFNVTGKVYEIELTSTVKKITVAK